MTTHPAQSWSEMITPTSDADIAGYVARTKTWLMRSGGTMAVRHAELVGDMVVLSGMSVYAGPCAASVPVAELVARAA